jgi:Chloroplast envelope transporter
VHVDVGRTLFRANLESSEREGQVEGVKAFQKLVYVSSQLFGDLKSNYLTPWTARFDGVTPEQVSVAKRNGARMIFEGRLHGEHGGALPADADALRALAEVQKTVGLSDDAAANLVRELLAADTEGTIQAAVDLAKARGRSEAEHARAAQTLDELLARSRKLEQLAHEDGVLPGVGALTVKGTKFEGGSKNDLVDLYALYMKRSMAAHDTTLTDDAARNLNALAVLFALPAARVEERRAKIISEAYSRLLRDAVTSGRMDAAESPARELNAMITRVQMPGEQALAMHETFYQAKLRDCLADRRIDDADDAALKRTARLLCLTDDIVSRNDIALKGDIMREAVRAALEIGIDSFSSEEAEAVAQAKADLRLSDKEGMAILHEAGRARLVSMINGARNKGALRCHRCLSLLAPLPLRVYRHAIVLHSHLWVVTSLALVTGGRVGVVHARPQLMQAQ